MNKIDRINQLISQTKNKNNKNTNTTMSQKEINNIQHKYDELRSFTYIAKNKLKIGKNIRYYNLKEDKLSTHCAIMDIDYYDVYQEKPKTLLLYCAILKIQWKVSCKNYIFFEQYTKINKNYGNITDAIGQYGGDSDTDYLREQFEKYLAEKKNE